nr:P-loop NTPase fold protein [Nitrosomonas nitrosa]
MWSDNEAGTDLLGFNHLVAGLLSIVTTDALLPATIGVFGDWGSGKSSLLNMAAAELRNDEENLVLIFNGWLFEGYGDAKTALMGNILDALAEDQTLAADAKGLALKLLKRVNWWRVAGTVAKAGVGLAVAGPAGLGVAAGGDIAALGKDLLTKAKDLKEEDLSAYLRESVDHEERRSIREFRDDFATLLRSTKRKRLVVLIDDLDRCLPETVIETLEAIKLFLFVDHTAFVIGADERLVKYAVRRRFPELPGERAEVGRDYLEKLIQFPIRVPPLGRAETETYIGLLLASRGLDEKAFSELRYAAIEADPQTLQAARFGLDIAARVLKPVPGHLVDDLSLAERIAPVLASETLGNPRQCKRFLNMLSIRLAMAQSRGIKDLKPRVLAKLMLLEYYRTESFRQLAESQAEENGRPAALKCAEENLRKPLEAKPLPTKAASAPKKGASSVTKSEEAEVPEAEAVDIPLWLLDPWVVKWVKMEPSLADEDLRPYFYFSRDVLGPLGTATQRMSPAAQDAFRCLISPSEAEMRNGLKRAAAMSPADASAVFEALSHRVREEDDFSAESAAFSRIIEWTKARPELVGQLASLLSNLPEDRIPLATPMKLVGLPRDTPGDPVGKLFGRWLAGKLKAATEAAMKRPKS